MVEIVLILLVKLGFRSSFNIGEEFMKRYILGILVVLQMNNILGSPEFRKKFLNWQKSLTQSQKESMKDLISDYERAYITKNHDLLSYYQAAFEKIMDQWDSLYKPLTEVQTFYDSVKQYIQTHPKDKTVKEYLAAYNKFDQMPTDQKLYDKLVMAQKKLKSKINIM
jgi:hypothetical protein